MDEQLMLGLQNQHSVQLTHFVDGTDNVAELFSTIFILGYESS